MLRTTLTVQSTAGHPIEVHVYHSDRDEIGEYWYCVDNTSTVHLGTGDITKIESYSDFKEFDMFTAGSKIKSNIELAAAVDSYFDMLDQED